MDYFLSGHRFYTKTQREKRIFFVKLGTSGAILIGALGLFAYYTHLYFIGIIGLSIFLTLLAPFIDVPGLQKSGGLIYYSPLFLVEKPKNQEIKIHGGTLFDYWFVLNFQSNGKQRKQFIFQQFLIGLLRLIEDLEKKESTITKISGTSYFLNQNTAKRIGFAQVKTKGIQLVILWFNYFNLMITQSLAKNKWSLPQITASKSFESHPEILISKKQDIELLLKKLS